MGFENFDSGDDEQPDNPSGTHIYFYERGHERLPGEEGEDRYEQIAEAFENAKTSPDGIVRRYADSQYRGGLQEFLAEYVNSAAEALEQGDLSHLFSTIFGDEDDDAIVQMLASYLQDNPQVAQQLTEAMQEEPAAPEADD